MEPLMQMCVSLCVPSQVGATNRPEELDEAARRRMPKQLYIPLPCADARKHMILHQLRESLFLSLFHNDPIVHQLRESYMSTSDWLSNQAARKPDTLSFPALHTRTTGDVKYDLPPSDLEKIVAKTDGYSGSDMRVFIQEACQAPIRDAMAQHGSAVQKLQEKDLRPIR